MFTRNSGLSRWLSGKESACQCRGWGFDAWRWKWQPTPVFLPGKSPGQRSMVEYSPLGHKRVKHHLTIKQQLEIHLELPDCYLPCILNAQSFSCVQLFATPWTVAHQAPLSMGFSRQEYWSGLPFPPPEDLPDLGIKPVSPALLHQQVASLPLSHQPAFL